jgi:hypothetical protein
MEVLVDYIHRKRKFPMVRARSYRKKVSPDKAGGLPRGIFLRQVLVLQA